jgi:xylulokinase
LDRHDQPLTPIILWPDSRARQPANEASQRIEGLPLRETTGVPSIDHRFMASKLLWLRANLPESWPLIRRLCLLSDYLTLWMTGCHCTEAGAAGLTGLLDIHRLEWWPDACQRFGIPQSWLPECGRAGTDLGPIRAEIADSLGLPRCCHFVVGCLDQYAGAIGAGNVSPGGVSETTGTVLATVRCADRFDAALPSSVFQGPGFSAGIIFQMVFGDISANVLEAYRNSLPDRPDFETLVREAADVPSGAEGVRLDRLTGGIDGKPLFHGRAGHQGRGHCVRAILEAVAVALADQVEQLCGKQRPAEIRSAGGAARSALWRQIKADTLGCPVAATTCPEPTSLGAAMLAATALGMGHLTDLASAWVRIGPAAVPASHRNTT